MLPPSYRNETGVAEWGFVWLLGGVVAAAAWAFGAGWWSVLAMPGSAVLYVAACLLRR